MGKEKAGFLAPKAIANRIKAKGLQKLRWYCQMCQKQCRDENGFKVRCGLWRHFDSASITLMCVCSVIANRKAIGGR